VSASQTKPTYPEAREPKPAMPIRGVTRALAGNMPADPRGPNVARTHRN
jgi:hypothetical protein